MMTVPGRKRTRADRDLVGSLAAEVVSEAVIRAVSASEKRVRTAGGERSGPAMTVYEKLLRLQELFISLRTGDQSRQGAQRVHRIGPPVLQYAEKLDPEVHGLPSFRPVRVRQGWFSGGSACGIRGGCIWDWGSESTFFL